MMRSQQAQLSQRSVWNRTNQLPFLFLLFSLLHLSRGTEECGKFPFSSMLHPVHGTVYLNTTTLPPGIVHASFTGETVASVFVTAAQSACAKGRGATDVELSANVTTESLLCTRIGQGKRKFERKRSIVVYVKDEHNQWDDMLSAEYFGLNLWHFHANFFPYWLSLKLASLARGEPQDDESERPGIIMLLPKEAWARLDKTGNTPFVISTANLRAQLDRGGILAALVGLQTMAHGLGGRMLVGHQGTNLSVIQQAIQMHGFAPPDTWLTPPGKEGFLWIVPRMPESFASAVRPCTGSLLSEYSATLMRSSSVGLGFGTSIRDDEQSNQVARHVCLMSRQSRTRKGEAERFRLRNFRKEVFSKLILRLGSAVILSPQIDISSEEMMIPTDLSRASVEGQMRFVREECAVLMGIHGAGLTNALGLRPGTTVIEFTMHERQYRFFEHLTAILDDVEYKRVLANGTLFNQMFEGDFYFEGDEDRKIDEIVKMAKQTVRKSIRKQRWYSSNGGPGKVGLYDSRKLEML